MQKIDTCYIRRKDRIGRFEYVVRTSINQYVRVRSVNLTPFVRSPQQLKRALERIWNSPHCLNPEHISQWHQSIEDGEQQLWCSPGRKVQLNNSGIARYQALIRRTQRLR